jgi:poly-gamma-glutamate capsule biosynthesis protein CapA/YwtB (metallophosphatase superfamily)
VSRWLKAAIPVALILLTGAAALASGEEPNRSSNAKISPVPRATTAGFHALGSEKPVVLAFAGDVHFESPIRERLAESPASVLAAIAPVLRRADVAVVNLETAVTGGGSSASKQYVFRTPSSAFDALRAGAVDVASMANNHGMDYGLDGLRDSLAASRAARFPLIGIGRDDAQAYRPYRTTVRGQRIAIIGATQVLDDHLISAWSAGPHKPGLASAKNVPRLLRAVRNARGSSDTVVVYLHWGVELARCASADQRGLARQLVTAGADIVVGGHAHRLLGTGRMSAPRLRRALVSYGLGNFVWYSTGEVTTQSGVLLVAATGRRIDRYRFEPARIVGGSPQPLEGSERARAITSWRGLRSCSGLKP